MAYTILPTQSAGQVASAAGWANLVKANFDAVPNVIPKTADQSVTSSTALVDDTHLQFAIGANEIYEFCFTLAIPDAPGGLKVALNAPTAATGWWALRTTQTSTGVVQLKTQITATFVDGETQTNVGLLADVETITGFVLNSSTAGTFKLRWAQTSSHGTSTTIKRGSSLARRKV